LQHNALNQSRNTRGQGADYDGDFNVIEYQSITYSHDVEDQVVGGTIQAINDRLGRTSITSVTLTPSGTSWRRSAILLTSPTMRAGT
jgi:hypothetical protein